MFLVGFLGFAGLRLALARGFDEPWPRAWSQSLVSGLTWGVVAVVLSRQEPRSVLADLTGMDPRDPRLEEVDSYARTAEWPRDAELTEPVRKAVEQREYHLHGQLMLTAVTVPTRLAVRCDRGGRAAAAQR